MANTLTGKFWALDSTGVISTSPIYIKNVNVTWKVSSAGAVEMNEISPGEAPGAPIVYAKSLGATSAAGDQLTQTFFIDNWVAGLYLKTLTNIDKLVVNIK